eukprot:TRINITY_DN11705_c0_g1_i1.p1 TRINITY_DN11705_c0_g1~~TRINITY_DN11705_c0_g1_i1.p1  ORF type:complete len:526 (+),score=55.36 TRINITY_DN11705_c0_g1_i1:52-1578(+)
MVPARVRRRGLRCIVPLSREISLLSGIAAGASLCDSGWKLSQSWCFRFFDIYKSHDAANVFCQNQRFGANLASIRDASQNYNAAGLLFDAGDAWIGAVYDRGVITWKDGSEYIYSPGKDGTYGGDVACGKIHRQGPGSIFPLWSFSGCSTSRKFVCSYWVDAVPPPVVDDPIVSPLTSTTTTTMAFSFGNHSSSSDSGSDAATFIVVAVLVSIFLCFGVGVVCWFRAHSRSYALSHASTVVDPHVIPPETSHSPREIHISHPRYWMTADGEGKAYEMETDEVKTALQALVSSTWKSTWTRDRGETKVSKLEVLMVHRNENPKIWANYYRKREEFSRKYAEETLHPVKTKGDKAAEESPELRGLFERAGLRTEINEKYLFHGTKPSAARAICTDDFSLRKAGSNAGTLYGPGIYFAEASSKSDEYAADEKDGPFVGMYAMLVCRVLCGRVNYTDLVAPPVDELVDSVKKDGTHDSILGDREKCRGTYREFIIFDESQAYPEYVIVYRRV